MAIQIGKYKRPGIFLEETDNSVFSTPTVEGLTNLVIGVSKKGPVNTPIRLTSVSDLEAVFGQLDRNLERKGSFFHRTVSKMLESTPVYAMNLLLTDDTLDVVDYKSLSSSALYPNDVKREGSYRRFFDTTGFWKRDSESFINLTKSNVGYNDRAINITNLSDRFMSVFIVKTAVSGFDRTLLEWYGSIEKMPAYVNAQDYASDYMVDVVVVGGDWTNYASLAVDNRWSSYFNASGLIKSQIRNFANDRNVTLLSYYEGLSLIPYFRDLDGRNIFIETTINRDTDKTGLFCSFNADLVERDFYTGLVDLIGNSVVGQGQTAFDFLSYKETVQEAITFTNTPLDLPANVTSLFGGTFSYIGQGVHAFGAIRTETGVVANSNNRTGYFGEGSVYGVSKGATVSSSASALTLRYNVGANAYAIIGDTYISIGATAADFSINSIDYAYSTATASFNSAFVLGSTGEISIVNSYVAGIMPSVLTSDVVLGFVKFNVASQSFVGTPSFTDISVNAAGYKDYTLGALSTNDFYVSATGSNGVKIEFPGTNATATTSSYAQYRKIKMFNRLVSIIDSANKSKVTMLLNLEEKHSLENVTITNIVTSTTQDKSFVLNFEAGIVLTTIISGLLVFYTNDNELLLGSDDMITNDTLATPTSGIVAKYSTFYTSFYDGGINTGDFFYDNILTDSKLVTFINGENSPAGLTSSYAGFNYIVFDSAVSLTGIISVPSSVSNRGTFTVLNSASATSLATGLGFTASYAYEVVENVVDEVLIDVTVIYDVLTKHYLKMFLDASDKLYVSFMDVLLTSSVPVELIGNNTFYVQSDKSNLKQTLEIELPTGYVQVPNKVLVDGSRYTEVRVGDFLLADTTGVVLQNGQMARKLTRVLSKRQYVGDSSLSEITCDGAILKTLFNGDLQTTRYSTIDQYATTYKGISLRGFEKRNASLPDGTEAKQNQILNLVAKGTPLFKSIVNKEAFDFRYLVDAFGLGLTERSKQQLVDICGERLDVFGFINMPSIKSFKNSSSPTFVDAEGVFQVEFMAKGGDPESNPAFLYSFGEGEGTTCTGYFTPYVTVNDNGRPLDFPPASFVATTYMRKHISNISSITPWTISAGITNGRITNIAGLEIDFDPTDIEFLNGAQMNPIVLKKNRGYIIETENTGLTLYKSALSLIHVREVLIELERELSSMLLEYQWKYNTPDVRAEIKLRADVICETYVSKNGLFNYFNKMDEENNTSEVIDNQIGVIDTYVEPIKGMGIIVNNITILRTGAISAAGFANV
jgi:hypothetical protein